VLRDPCDVFEDDPTVLDSDVLYRMVRYDTVQWDGENAVRARTNAFQDQPPQRAQKMGYPAVALSVYLGSILQRDGIDPANLVEDSRWRGGYGVASITAGQARLEGQGVARDPLPDSAAHCLVFARSGRKKTKGQSKALARHAIIVVPPPRPASAQ